MSPSATHLERSHESLEGHGIPPAGARIGIVAGSGRYPVALAEALRRMGYAVLVVAHRGETDESIRGYADEICWVRVGQLGALLSFFGTHAASHAVFAGGISRAALFRGAYPDWQAVRLIARLGTIQDDVILRGIAAEVEAHGIRVLGPSAFLPEFIPEPGLLTVRNLSDAEMRDAARGWQAATAIGALDIGQTVVVCDGLVVAVEAVEGTDRAIQRAGDLTGRGKREGKSTAPDLIKSAQRAVGAGLMAVGAFVVNASRQRAVQDAIGSKSLVVVKRAKPQQDLRLDLPTIGVNTIEQMNASGAKALVIEAGRSLLLDPALVLPAADSSGIAILAVNAEHLPWTGET